MLRQIWDRIPHHLARQTLVFGLVGVAATLTHLTTAIVARRLFHASPLESNFAGYCLAVGVSYFGHARFTFGVKVRHAGQFARFVAASLAGLALGQGLTWLLVERLHLPFEAGLAVVVVAVPLFSFVVSRALVFRPHAS